MRSFRIAALIAVAVVAPLTAQAPQSLTPHQRLAREIYSQLISINTADTVGSVTRAVDAMAARFRAAGFPDSDVKILTPPGKPTKANLIVRYHGTGGANGAKPLLLLAHLDVVAAKRADWPRDPFTLVEQNGFFYGRGTSDDKAMAAIFVANLLRMKREGYVPDRDLVLALTADEESGPANGVDWLIRTHPELVDVGTVINEGGGGTLRDGKPLVQSLQVAQKVTTNLTLLNTPAVRAAAARRVPGETASSVGDKVSAVVE